VTDPPVSEKDPHTGKVNEPPSLAERIDRFCLEHRLCARLDGSVEPDATGRRYVVIECSCGASLVRRTDEP
jgi:hypothetical protein